jgi:hypothetical protein
MNRFVILLHKFVGVDECEHWDVMFEIEVAGYGQLDTWSIPPQLNSIQKELNAFSCPAKHLPLHRIIYLNYEGDISNNRGNVKKIDKGTYKKINENKFKLYGNLLNGKLTIENNKNNPNSFQITYMPE